MQIKKIFQLGLTLSILCTATISLAALWGDINRDEKIGLAEAIYALQVSSGLKPQYVNETHTGTLTSNETWTPNGNPHIISGTLTIAGDPPNGATLTIQPGVEVWFEENASIEIGKDNSPGTLQALGSEISGIVFTSNQSSKTKGWWNYIRFNEQAVNCRMSYCNIEYGGGYDNWNTAGNVVIYKAENVIVNNCTITKSGTNGVFFVGNTGFVIFLGNTITGNGDSGISLYADQVRGIDVTNQVAGNELGGVYIRKDTVTNTATWYNLDAPYIVGDVTVADTNGVTLTISPGTELKFEENASIEIGKDNSPGTLQALGSEISGIVFTSNQSSKTKGWWNYIRFNEQAVNCRMSYCNIEYGGGYDNWNTAGNVVIYKAENVIVKNCTITKSGTNGVFFVDNTGFVTFSDNTITGNGDNENKNYGRYGISLYADQVRGIDVTNQVAGNELGGVYIRKDTVTNTATWYNLDAPYIVGDVTVADTNGVTLTLKAGTQFRFIEGSMFEVGAADKPGTLVADGTAGDILFTGHQTVKTKGWWNGIRFNSTAVNCILKNCKVEYGGGYASWNSAANVVVITQNGTDIYDSDISNSENYGMKFLSGGTANIEDTAFSTNNLEDIYIYDNNSGYTGSPAGSPSIKGP